jgi:hypothetical protein
MVQNLIKNNANAKAQITKRQLQAKQREIYVIESKLDNFLPQCIDLRPETR